MASIPRAAAATSGSRATDNAALSALGKDPRLTVVTAEPLNVETPLALLDTQRTPVERMFMRNHAALAEQDAAGWRLTIDGLVERPLTLDLAALLEQPPTSCTAVLECSGNGRQAFAEAGLAAEGLPWGQGAVACAEWTGAPAALLLERAGVLPGAVQAECAGGEREPFVRGVEVAQLLDGAILAYAVNGAPLPAAHGGPVRLVVPGWGGVNWVKWLTHMRILAHESPGEQNQDHYVLYDAAGTPTGKVRELLVKSIITAPGAGATLRPGRAEVRGWAWSAGRGIARVEVSADGGASWREAELDADPGRHAWRGFRWPWDAAPGRHTLVARATDGAGERQPMEAPHNTRGYLNNAWHRVEVGVC
jgi:DMSO/TMAO reductase YedYZ molybdopterin-dependent catalytic subunit